MNLDTTKVYYLGDLSDEQLYIFREQLIKDGFTWNEPILIGHLTDKYCCVKYKSELNKWCFSNEKSKSTNALTLFTQTKDERIAQIQLRIQELNNELIELDEEMRRLTYED